MRKLMIVLVTTASLLTVAGCGKKKPPTAAQPTGDQPAATEPANGSAAPAAGADDKKPDENKAGGW